MHGKLVQWATYYAEVFLIQVAFMERHPSWSGLLIQGVIFREIPLNVCAICLYYDSAALQSTTNVSLCPGVYVHELGRQRLASTTLIDMRTYIPANEWKLCPL